MHFESDDYFVIGRSHVRQCMPCQDYALSAATKEYAYAIVSDGCSTGNRTDIGSRLTALIASKILNDCFGNKFQVAVDFHIQRLHAHLNISSLGLGLTTADMLSTCMIAVVYNDTIVIKVLGDGVVAIKYIDGTLELSKIEWQNNMPFYPIYRLDMSAFEAAHRNTLPLSKHTVIVKDSKEIHSQIDHFSINDVDNIFPPLINVTRPIEYIGVFSDGVCQVDGIGWIDVVSKLMAFPTSKGFFLKRRMNSLNSEFLKTGKGSLDDMSGSIIHIVHED